MPNIATFETEHGTATIDCDGARETIWEYLYGRLRWRVSNDDWFAIYAQADGFGDCRTGAARDELRAYVEQGSDWSHVRDSSPEALSRVLAEIIARQI